METVEQGRPALKKKPYRERLLTIMVMGGLGRIHSFRVSRRILLWSSLFFAAFVLFSIVIINRYLALREANNELLDKMDLMEEDLNNNKKALQRSRQLTAFLEEYISDTEERPETPSQAEKEGTAQEKRAESSKSASSKDTAEGAKAKSLAELFQMKDILIEQQGAKLSVSFRLEVSQPGANRVRGYLHIIAEDSTSDPRQWWAYPRQKLINGLPENFRSGHAFSIYRSRLIHGRIQLGSPSISPSAIKVLIYDQSGTLVTEKNLELTHES
jgi:hypothetical protein